VVRRSAVDSPLPRSSGTTAPILLIDTIGELAAVWGLADIAFVGGSLRRGRGGQNMMEPAAYGAAVMFGPHVANFRDTVDQLLERNAARQIANDDELAVGLLDDLNDPEAAAKRGNAGRTFVLAQNGASGRTVLELDRLVEMSYMRTSERGATCVF
jgi:3-deoxy-D-manno-octulosonic-acid transferase